MGARKNLNKPQNSNEELRRWEERFESLIDLSSEWYWEQDEECRFTLVTGSAAGHGGIDTKNFLGTYRWDRGAVPVGDGGSWDKHKAALKARQPFTDFLFKRPDSKGGMRYISTSGQPIVDGKGRFRGYRGIAKDITDALHAQEEQRRFRAAMDASADLMLLIDPSSLRYVDVNDAACRALGYSREELLTMGPADIFSTSREQLARLYERMIAGELSAPTVKGQYRRKDGSQLSVEAYPRAVRSGEGHVIVSIARDVSERLAAEETLRRFRVAMDNSADMIVLIDRTTMRFVDVNETACRLLGYSREELLKMGPQDVLPTSRKELERAYDEFIATPSHIPGMRSHYRCKH